MPDNTCPQCAQYVPDNHKHVWWALSKKFHTECAYAYFQAQLREIFIAHSTLATSKEEE